MADTMHDLLRALHISTGFVGLTAFWIPALTRKGGRLHVAAGRVFAACAYAVALTALGSTSWALLHPSSWAGEPVSPGQVPADEIMFVAILGLLGLLLLHGVETGVRAMRTRRHPDQFAGWRLRLLSLAVPAAGLGLFVFGLFHLVQGSGGLLDPRDVGGRRHRRLLRGSPVFRQSLPHTDGVVVHAHGRDDPARPAPELPVARARRAATGAEPEASEHGHPMGCAAGRDRGAPLRALRTAAAGVA